MPALTRASRANDSKLTESTPWLRRFAAPAGGYVEPSRTLSPTSTRIGSPMLPIIEKHGPGWNTRDDRQPVYPISRYAARLPKASQGPPGRTSHAPDGSPPETTSLPALDRSGKGC